MDKQNNLDMDYLKKNISMLTIFIGPAADDDGFELMWHMNGAGGHELKRELQMSLHEMLKPQITSLVQDLVKEGLVFHNRVEEEEMV